MVFASVGVLDGVTVGEGVGVLVGVFVGVGVGVFAGDKTTATSAELMNGITATNGAVPSWPPTEAKAVWTVPVADGDKTYLTASKFEEPKAPENEYPEIE